MMSKFPQIYVQQKYKEFLQKLAEVGKPKVVDASYVKTLGFKSSYDANFLAAIKFIGLVEDKRNGAPTEAWTKLRLNFGETLAEGLKAGYSDLFSFYPDANLRDEEALSNYFRGNSDGDAESVGRMVNAFVAVREIASFCESIVEEIPEAEGDDIPTEAGGDVAPKVQLDRQKSSGKTPVNINIQLQLPADATGDIYDKFFEAMKKHGLI